MTTHRTVGGGFLAYLNPWSGNTESRRTFKDYLFLGMLQILMTLLAATFLVPTIWMVSSSLKVSTEVFAHPIVWWPAEPYWRNYVNAFQGHLPLGLFMQNTAVIVFFAVLGTLFSSSLVAYSLPAFLGQAATSGLDCCLAP